MYVAQNITESVNLWQEVVYPPVPTLKISLEQMRSAKHGETVAHVSDQLLGA